MAVNIIKLFYIRKINLNYFFRGEIIYWAFSPYIPMVFLSHNDAHFRHWQESLCPRLRFQFSIFNFSSA